MRINVFILLCVSLAGCNSIYMKPSTLDTSEMIYTPRGGYSMQRSIKQVMDEHGYKTHVGRLHTEKQSDDLDLQTFDIPQSAKYVVYVRERKEVLRPIWCIFNGFWWWNFNTAIIDRENGKEILSWRGRGCQNSSLRKLNEVLDQLEMKK